MKKGAKLSILASALALGLASCANDELKEVYEGDEITFSTRVTRATPTTLGNLDGFYVYGDAGQKYTDLLIKGDTALRVESGSSIYKFKRKVTWPVDVDKIRFWAYGPMEANDWLKPYFSQETQIMRGIEVKSDLVKASTLPKDSIHLDNSGTYHHDLVCAYTDAIRHDANGMQVKLEFHHAFSQIEVNIKKGSGFEEGRVVKVKGAWIVNVHSRGDLEFDGNLQNKNYMNWATNTSVSYGRRIAAGQPLGNKGIQMLHNDNESNNSSLMLLPQRFKKYDFQKKLATAADMEADSNDIHNYNSDGTYILILCRVETEHRYAVDGTDPNTAVGDLIEGGQVVGHTHQLFPISRNEKGEPIWKGDAYGYTCVPIEGEWIAGKKYIYTLEFCGKDSGAGLYPPEPLPDVFPEETPRGDDKKGPGDPVLDNPISFDVTISDWNVNPTENNTPMN